MDCSHEIKRHLFLGRKVITNLDSILKSRDIALPTMVHLVKAVVFPVIIYGWENWTIKKAERQRTVVLEKTLESPLDCKKIQPVHSKGDQSWVFFGRTDAEAREHSVPGVFQRIHKGARLPRWLNGKVSTCKYRS